MRIFIPMPGVNERFRRAAYSGPVRFYSLDVLRGVAALSVVLWHWRHFFFPLNAHGVTFIANKQPLFEVLSIFYKYGGTAVQLFFSLSGFIFFWLYSKRISDGTISLKSFSVLRLSRLYPLHFVTLVVVAAGQIAFVATTNSSFVFQNNDAYHFFLNIFFASSWGLEQGFSFNGPVWSVSVEILLYAMFFVFCRIFQKNIAALIFAVILGYLEQIFNGVIGSGMVSFFLGGLVFSAYERIVKMRDPWRVSICLFSLTSIAWLTTILATGTNIGFFLYNLPFLGSHPLILQKIFFSWPILVLFPLTIMSLALIETKRGTLGKRLSFIGDISYSSYLLHFPLQLVMALVTAKLAIGQELFYSPWFMLLFFSALLLLSLASHRYFEVPMQRFLRNALNNPGQYSRGQA